MAKIHVEYSDPFFYGVSNTPFCIDFSFLSQEQLQSLILFVRSVTDGSPVIGKNKQSWLDDNLRPISGADYYAQNNYWHCHIGPSYSNAPIKSLTYNLNVNLSGITSSEVVHYKKLSSNHIIIDAYSSQHVPFLTQIR